MQKVKTNNLMYVNIKIICTYFKQFKYMFSQFKGQKHIDSRPSVLFYFTKLKCFLDGPQY